MSENVVELAAHSAADVRRKMATLGLSDSEAAEISGLSRTTISKLKNGKKTSERVRGILLRSLRGDAKERGLSLPGAAVVLDTESGFEWPDDDVEMIRLVAKTAASLRGALEELGIRAYLNPHQFSYADFSQIQRLCELAGSEARTIARKVS